jgi:DNA-binding response OmpR family regulator
MSPDVEKKNAPKLVIGLIRGEMARGLEAHFKQIGWRVCSADSGHELRERTRGGRATAVVLPVSAEGIESGFLTCAKLIRVMPKTRFVLVGPLSDENERLARFAGAAGYVTETATTAELIAAVTGKPIKAS